MMKAPRLPTQHFEMVLMPCAILPANRCAKSLRLSTSRYTVLEVTHGDGLAGSSFRYPLLRTNEMDLIERDRAR